GAFTGIRIGLAAARGLGLAAGLPVFGVTTFAAVAAAAGRRAPRPLLVALDSRRDHLFLQRLTAPGPPDGAARGATIAETAALAAGGAVALAGDGVPRVLAALAPEAARGCVVLDIGPPDPAIIARLAAARWRAGERPRPPAPFYLRAP